MNEMANHNSGDWRGQYSREHTHSEVVVRRIEGAVMLCILIVPLKVESVD